MDFFRYNSYFKIIIRIAAGKELPAVLKGNLGGSGLIARRVQKVDEAINRLKRHATQKVEVYLEVKDFGK